MVTRDFVDPLMVLLVVMNLRLVSSSRLTACIRTVAIEGMALGLLPLLLLGDGDAAPAIVIAVASFALRGVLFPRLLLRNVQDANVQLEVQPYVSYTLSTLAAVGALILGFWMSRTLPLPASANSALVVPVAMSTILTGLFVLVSRRLAVNQVLGYIVLENGIYVLGLSLVEGMAVLVEMGVLLDAFVAVFVMSLATLHIRREFDHIGADQLDRLRG